MKEEIVTGDSQQRVTARPRQPRYTLIVCVNYVQDGLKLSVIASEVTSTKLSTDCILMYNDF